MTPRRVIVIGRNGHGREAFFGEIAESGRVQGSIDLVEQLNEFCFTHDVSLCVGTQCQRNFDGQFSNCVKFDTDAGNRMVKVAFSAANEVRHTSRLEAALQAAELRLLS